MPPSKHIYPRILSMARKGDISALGALRAIILESPHSSTEDIVDTIFQTLATRSAPSRADIDHNFALVALKVAGPALCLSMFWSILSDKHMKPVVKGAIVRNLLELSTAFLRWIHFCLETGQPYLPQEQIPGAAHEDERRYLTQARLILDILKLSDTCAEVLFNSDAFIDLFLELWTAELIEDGSRSVRVIDVSTHSPCPIVSIGFKIVMTGATLQIFLRRCGTKKGCSTFIEALMDRIVLGLHPINWKISGWTETLIEMLHIAKTLWSSSPLYHRLLQRASFLRNFGLSWHYVSMELMEEGFRPADRFSVLIPSLKRLFIMAFDDTNPAARYRNWHELNGGDLFGTFFQAVAGVDVEVWDSIEWLIRAFSPFLVYPRMVSPTSFGDVSEDSVTGHARATAFWSAFFRGFKRMEAACNLLTQRPHVHICDNRMASRGWFTLCEAQLMFLQCGGTTVDPAARFKQCASCSSTIYCSMACQKQDWKDQHQKECAARKEFWITRKATGSTYGHSTRASQATLLELVYAERKSPKYEDRSVIPVFDFTSLYEDSIGTSSYDHHLFGFETYWRRRSTSPTSFPQAHLRPRLESLANAYSSGEFPAEWRLAEGIFPGYGDEKAIYLTVLLKPVEDAYRSVYCIARIRMDDDDMARRLKHPNRYLRKLETSTRR